MSKRERVCRSLQIYVALKCRQPWQEIRDGKKASLSSFSPNQWRKWIWMPSGVRGKEIQGLMRSLKDACGQYRNFSAGSLPECVGCHGACRKHMQTQTTARGTHKHVSAVPLLCIVTYRKRWREWRRLKLEMRQIWKSSRRQMLRNHVEKFRVKEE